MTTQHPTALSLRGVRKEFAGKVALAGLDLDVAPGEFLVLLGPSGSGKTTTLRCLAGIEKPTAGTISIGGTLVAGPATFVPPERRKLAMVFQDYALWPHLTVAKNVEFPMKIAGATKHDRARRVGELLDRVGLSALSTRFPNELSGGEQQRVALARALAADVGLILFDEPLSNLDADRRESLRIAIATLARESGATVVYITHDQAEAFALADKVGILERGSLVQLGTPEEIYRTPASPFVARFTGLAGEFPVEVVARNGATVDVAINGVAGLTVTQIPCPSPGPAASLFIRATAVSLTAATSGAHPHGVIDDVAFTGRGYEHVVNLGSLLHLTKIFAPHRFERGTAVDVVIDGQQCFVMDPEQRER